MLIRRVVVLLRLKLRRRHSFFHLIKVLFRLVIGRRLVLVAARRVIVIVAPFRSTSQQPPNRGVVPGALHGRVERDALFRRG